MKIWRVFRKKQTENHYFAEDTMLEMFTIALSVYLGLFLLAQLTLLFKRDK